MRLLWRLTLRDDASSDHSAIVAVSDLSGKLLGSGTSPSGMSKRAAPWRAKRPSKLAADSRAASSVPPVGEARDLFLNSLPRVLWLGEKDEGGDMKCTQGREARARAEEALQVYVLNMQQRSPLTWFREGDALLTWREAVKDPIAVILGTAALQNAEPEEVLRRLVSSETATVLVEEALQKTLGGGDTCGEVPKDRLLGLARRLLLDAVSAEASAEVVPRLSLQSCFDALRDEAYGFLSHTKGSNGVVYTSTMTRGVMDRRLHAFLTTRNDFYAPPPWPAAEQFTAQQAAVFAAVLEHLGKRGWSVLSGPGGSGKTHMLRHLLQQVEKAYVIAEPDGADCPACGEERLVQRCEKCGYQRQNGGHRNLRACFMGPTNRAVAVLLAATMPNGAAAISAVYGTIHSMARRSALPPQDIVIVDESSMLTSEHGDLLLRCKPLRKACWLFVGDHLQLPPVGAGELLRPLMTLGALPSLQQNLRASSTLAPLIDSIRNGLPEEALCHERNFPSFPELMEGVRGSSCDLVLCVRNEERIRYNAFRIQLHVCSHARLCALDDYRKLNAEWSSASAPPRCFIPFVGMPVRLQTNAYRPEACRGSLARIEAVRQDGRVWHLDVSCGNSVIKMEASYFLIPELVRPAFATTLHDAQGAQQKCVGIVLPPSARCPLLSLETLYTAASRAQEKLIFFSCGDKLSAMLPALRNRAPPRQTPLALLLGQP